MLINGISHIPLQSFSDRADQLVQDHKKKLARERQRYPPGLEEQHELQLQLMEDPKVPDLELMLFPFVMDFFPVPDMTKPYLTIIPIVGHPFTRGTIVRISALRVDLSF